MSFLVLSDVAYAFPDDTPLFDGLDLAVGPGLTSLVGRNGAGKSTLLRLIAGERRPTRGSITVDGDPAGPPTVGYLPQLLADAPAERTLADELGVGGRLEALARIEAGEGDDDDFELVGDDWAVAERTVALLDDLGLPTELDRPVVALSGGERTLAAVAGRLLGRPRVLLLDEPTNNLDGRARERLFAAIGGFVGGGDRVVLVVSHDLELLDRAGRTVELRAGRCRVFGGPYAHYREVIETEQAAAVQSLAGARNDLRAERRDRVEGVEKASRRVAQGRRVQAAGGMPKVLMNARRASAQESAGRLRAVHDQGVEQARERMRSANAAVRREERLRVELPDPGLPAGRVVLDVDDPVAGRVHLAGPARVRLAGPNGSGKTTLLRRLLGARGPDRAGGVDEGFDDEGFVDEGFNDEVVHVPFALLPQDLRVEHPEWSVIDAILAVRPDASEEEAHAHAARLLFTGGAGFRRLADLSGGERLRAALAARLFARPVPQLLVLDEPTNNLDLDGVEVLADALSQWRGALLLISHDDGFCDRVGVDDVITLG
ncbi:ATP-binding cassette domain-containing protein [Dietzia maris]|uniref:ATP-binding cassette domain-containing protein n=1 Tax=Dietzia maris TaxID=37915 RepID=UPI0021AFC43B|nr:ATP-binding cassette domain-containing protein [Dietzia maris]MCT1434871.1 ATP-binding cassette domain-containing protein [Dietzia maris]MCT1522624.1 ATP-binding cassette domain-containing protein [Dietzia maris]